MKPLIGVVTVLFNSDDVLPGFFESLARQRDVCFRLYVIDNSKTDSGSRISQELAARYNIDVEIVFNNDNVGVAKGNNQGIELALQSGCNQILLSNNDIEFKDPDLISSMIAFGEKIGAEAVVPKIYYHSDPTRIWCAGGQFSVFSATTPHFGDGDQDQGQYDRERPVEYAPTCFMLLRSEVFSEIGMMDERYFVYFDDTDFLWRMKASGKQLYYWPHGKVWHKVSFSTGGSESIFSLYYGFRNRIFFIRKNYSKLAGKVSLAYIFATLVVKFIRFDRDRRDAVWRGVRAGFAMQL